MGEAVIGITNKVGCVQWQHSMAQRLAAFLQSNGGHFKQML
jgi:hypothetical protein